MNSEELDRFSANKSAELARLEHQVKDLKSGIESEDLDIDGTAYLFNIIISSIAHLRIKLSDAVEMAKEELVKKGEDDE